MSLLFAAIGATVTALVEVSVVPYLAVAGAVPHPVLIGAVVWTVAAGLAQGITWAFVGGLVLDSLLGRPLGASALSLLVVAGVAALVAQPFPRLRLVVPIVGVPILSLGNSLLVATLSAGAQAGIAAPESIQAFVPGAVYDAVIGMFVGPIAVVLHDRRAPSERLEW